MSCDHTPGCGFHRSVVFVEFLSNIFIIFLRFLYQRVGYGCVLVCVLCIAAPGLQNYLHLFVSSFYHVNLVTQCAPLLASIRHGALLVQPQVTLKCVHSSVGDEAYNCIPLHGSECTDRHGLSNTRLHLLFTQAAPLRSSLTSHLIVGSHGGRSLQLFPKMYYYASSTLRSETTLPLKKQHVC